MVSRKLEEAGLSLRETALRAGIPLTTLHRRLGGTSPFTLTELVALAELLDTTASVLMAEAEAVSA